MPAGPRSLSALIRVNPRQALAFFRGSADPFRRSLAMSAILAILVILHGADKNTSPAFRFCDTT